MTPRWGAGSVVEVYEHIAGGGRCASCIEGRGALVHTADGRRFLCVSCIASHREACLRLFGHEPDYGLVIDDANVVWP
ncbi:hypothetical protein [Nocardia sp. CNY236]|uniref:hypothetical protein n=1 Tax=Nocardia sp. CNY236 TaxID=1169152 RepID=UPI0012DD3881|nr:hypothetical protein [Nocardia sp. CNY236]